MKFDNVLQTIAIRLPFASTVYSAAQRIYMQRKLRDGLSR